MTVIARRSRAAAAAGARADRPRTPAVRGCPVRRTAQRLIAATRRGQLLNV
ncbi:hypothetical protein AB0L97_11255 [Nocardia sp. NPDC051911]|uniref:hypothetical protein n=1 Tax=Nocardia sp. NPDC051911 TaxID=3154648 RepID=UPI003438F35D